MDLQGPPRRRRGGRECPGRLQIAHRLGEVVLQQHTGVFHRRHPQDEDGEPDPGPPELHRLVQAGHRQVVRSQLLQLSGHRHRAVAVGVGLHHAQEFAARLRQTPKGVVVPRQPPQVDLRPGPLLCILHRLTPLSLIGGRLFPRLFFGKGGNAAGDDPSAVHGDLPPQQVPGHRVEPEDVLRPLPRHSLRVPAQ